MTATHLRSDATAMIYAIIQLNVAGIRSTGVVLMQALVDLATHPWSVQELLSEVETVRGDKQQPLSPRELDQLVKMDSFLKESQRHVPQNILSVYRKVMSPLTLRDGTILPTGSYVCVPSIDTEATLTVKPTGEKPVHPSRAFDPFRWSRLRVQSPKTESRYLSVTTGPNSLEFGHGSHACPGRFFATNVMKSVLVAVLEKYEICLADVSKQEHEYNKVLVLNHDTARTIGFKARSSLV